MTAEPATTWPADPPTGTGRLEQVHLGPFECDDGTTLPELTVAYRHDGQPPESSPQILVIHALTGSADAAGDWWEPLIGPGRALDTDRYGVLCANLLGGRYGTTGPTSTNPRTGRPYGDGFPAISTADQARARPSRCTDAERAHGRECCVAHNGPAATGCQPFVGPGPHLIAPRSSRPGAAMTAGLCPAGDRGRGGHAWPRRIPSSWASRAIARLARCA